MNISDIRNKDTGGQRGAKPPLCPPSFTYEEKVPSQHDERDTEPRNYLRFCPHCGSGSFASVNFKEFKCNDCGFDFFVNSAAAVVAVIFDSKGRILLTRRARNPYKGYLDLPGGFVDPGESAEEALRREIKEELCIDVESAEYLCSHPNEYIFSNYKVRTTDLAFICQVNGIPTTCADDVSSFAWFSPKDIDLSEIAFGSIRKIVKAAIANTAHGKET